MSDPRPGVREVQRLYGLVDRLNDALEQTTWRNRKTGGLYTVLLLARHSETGEEMAVYMDGAQVWVRPLALFLEKFECVSGTERPR